MCVYMYIYTYTYVFRHREFLRFLITLRGLETFFLLKIELSQFWRNKLFSRKLLLEREVFNLVTIV